MIKGSHHSFKSIRKMCESHKGMLVGEKNPMYGVHLIGEKNPAFGKHPSEESREKMRMKKLGITLPEETKRKIGLAHKGHLVLEKTRKKISEKLKGEKHPNWQGGKSFEPYCVKFNKEFKERVRAFFNYTCQMPNCNRVWREGEKRLAVHHINFQKDACCTEDVIPLFVPVCSGKCHTTTNHNRVHWQKYFTELIMTKYEGKCYLPNGRNIA